MRLAYAEDYQVTVAIGWLGALFLARQSTLSLDPGLGLRVVGAATAVGSVVAMVIGPGYHSFYRLTPLGAGVGLALAAGGPRALAQHKSSLLMLALPLVNSPPKLLHRIFDPGLIPVTTWSAMVLNRVVGHPITMAEGHWLRMPNDELDIVDGCSGLWAITRLFVLAALVVALFPTTLSQRVALFASALVVGFCVNAVRVSVLAATVLHGNDVAFAYWHQGLGATLFAIGSSSVAGLAWWITLRDGESRACVPRG
jgi:exosortase